MKRFTRRFLAIVLGLSLGWFAAGFLPSFFQPDQAVGQESQNHAAPVHSPPAHDQPASISILPPHTPHAQPHHAPDPAAQSISLLVPQPQDVPWLKPVLIAIAALFAAAIFLGLPILKFKSPDPTDPADDHHHSDSDHHPAPHASTGHANSH